MAAKVEKQVEEVRRWLAAASDIARTVNADVPVEVLLSRIAAEARDLVALDMCAVMLASPTGDRLVVRGSDGLSPEYVDQLNTDHPLLIPRERSQAHSPSVQAFISKKTITIPDVTSAADFEPWRELALREGYGALVATPLFDDRAPAGVLVGYSLSSRSFTEAHLELLQLLAENAGTALQTARLRLEAKMVIEQLHQANAELVAQRQSLEVAQDQHRRLMQVVAEGIGPEGIVKMLADLLNASVTLEGQYGDVIAAASAGDYQPPPSALTRATPALEELLCTARNERAGAIHVHVDEGDRRQVWLAPITIEDKVVANLWVVGSTACMKEVDRRGIERFALALALELAKQRSALHAQIALSLDLVSELLTTIPDAQRRVLHERASARGYDLSKPQLVIVGATDEDTTDRVREPAEKVRLVEAGITACHLMDIPGLVGGLDREVVLLVPATEDRRVGVKIAQAIQGEMRRTRNPLSASFVIGHEARDIAEIASHARAARGALRLAMRKGPGSITDFETLGIHGLLLTHPDPDPLIRFSAGLLGPLRDRDQKKGSDLLLTLRTWLGTGRSTTPTSEQLIVHPNTVIYRIKTIEELLGRSLREEDFIAELQLALMVADVAGALADGSS